MKCPIDKDNLSLSFLLMFFIKYQNEYYKYFLKNYEINIQHIPILFKLLNHEYIYQKDISKDLKIDNGLLTRNLRKLEDLGYIQRIEDDDNRRQNKINLTDNGRKLALKIKEEGIRREEKIMENSQLTREELIDIFLELLHNSKEFNEEMIK